MKYLHQALNLALITLAAEILRHLISLPIPASIYGLVLLFLLLKTNILKLSQIQDVGELLLELMPLLLVPASVSFVASLETIQAILLPVLIMSFIGTAVVMAVTGGVAQWIIRRMKGGKCHD